MDGFSGREILEGELMLGSRSGKDLRVATTLGIGQLGPKGTTG